MSITSVVNDTVTSVSLVNAQKPLPPTISGYSVGGLDDTALDPAGGQTVQINGTGFLPGATITFDGNAVAVVTYVSANQLTFTSPAKSAGTYTIYVVNADGGTAIYIPGIIYSVLPTWTTSAGSLGSVYETNNISTSVVASGDAPITYSLYSGSLPTGSTLYANGVITGTAPVDSSSTTYSFTIEAIDAQLQSSTRSFSLTINTDVVTWVSPANNTTYTSAVDSAIANVTLSATDAAGYAVTYTANALPTGLSLTGANISGTPTVIADSSTLLTATAATTNRTATRTINWSITVANDPYFEYNTLLIPGASTTFVDDASTNNFAVTIAGDTKPNSFNPYTPGYYSNYFDGNGDYLTIAHNANLSWTGNVDGSVEAWVYVTSYSSGINIVTKSDISGSSYPNYAMGINSSGKLTGYVGRSGFPGTTLGTTTSTSTISLNAWNHVLFTRQYVGGAQQNLYRVFINGVLEGATSNEAPSDSRAGSFVIGAATGGVGPFTGYISNLRFFNNAIPPAYQTSSTTVGTTIFTPSTTPLTAISGTQVLSCQSNRFIDNSTNNFTITASGNTSVNSLDPFAPNTSYSTYGSGYFDGTGDYLTVPGNSVFAFGTGDFTVEVWLYANSISTGTFDRICATSDYNGSGFDWTLNTNSSGFYLAGTSYNIGSITTGRWHHLVYTRSGSVIRGFLNGNLSSYTTGASQNVTSTSTLNIGIGYSGTYLNGYLVDLRIIKGSIPAGYQTSSTTTGTQIFTPPSSPLTAVSGTSLLTLQNNQSATNSVFLDNSTNNLLVTRNGNATQGTFSPYGGNWSNYIPSAGSTYLYAGSSTSLALGAGDFTFEGWFYIAALAPSYSTLADWRFAGGIIATVPVLTDFNNNGKLAFIYGNGSSTAFIQVVESSTTIPLSSWVHIAVVRSGTTVTMYFNGTSVGSATSAQDFGIQGLTIGNNQATNYTPSMYVSNLRLVKGTAVYTTAFTPSTTPLTPITNTSLLTCADNRLVDDSINNFTISKAGNVAVQRFSPFNPSTVTPTSYSGYFDGNGDYLSIANSTALQIGGGSFTVEAWIYPTNSGSYRTIIAKRSGGTAEWELTLNNSSNTLIFYTSSVYQTSNQITLNQWNHIAASSDGTTLKLFINGVQGFSGSVTVTNSTNAVRIGAVNPASSDYQYFPGYISNIRVVKGTALYTSNFTPPTTPLTAIANTSLLTCQSPTFIDNSTNNFTITAVGNSQPTQQNPFGYTSTTTNGYTPSTIGGSGYFDGTTDYLTVTNSSLVLGTNAANFTIECWVYNNGYAGSQYGRGIFVYYPSGGYNSNRLLFRLSSASNRLNVYLLAAGNAQFGISGADGTATITPNAWTHVSLVRNAGVFYVYVNGVLDITVTSSFNPVDIPFTTFNTIEVGRTQDGTGNEFIGYISDYRFINGTVAYTSNFAPPLQPLTAVTNTGLLLNMTSAGIYDAAMMNNLESVGDAKLSTAISKFGGTSMSFDGTGDYFSFINKTNRALYLSSGNWTVEMWTYYNTTGTYDHTLIGGTSFYDVIFGVYNFGTQLGFWNNNTFYGMYASSNLTSGVWRHVAYVRNSNTITLYINGTSVATQAFSGSMKEDGSADFATSVIGSSMNGYIDDLRITKGYARYTSNFTPPTVPFLLY